MNDRLHGTTSKRLFLALGMALYVATPSHAVQSPRQSVHGKVATPQESLIDRRGTEAAPLVVKSVENPDDAADRQKSEAHREQEATNSRWTMIFTGGAMAVGIFQLGFFAWQLSLMRSSVRDAANAAKAAMMAAKAAELNARGAIGMELPVIRVTPPDLLATDGLIGDGPYGGNVNDNSPTRFSAVGLFRFRNDGRTPAFPVHLAVGWQVATQLPDVPLYSNVARLNHAAVINPGDEYLVNEHYGIELNDAELASAAEGTSWLWFYGCLRYRDFLNEERNYRFCWRFANREFEGALFYFASDGEPPQTFIQSE